MKKITCELCGSNNLIKQDNVFVCEYCGTKYSLEEAKKLMLEVTVKIDNSERLRNLYYLAELAIIDEDWNNAKKYYDMIIIDDSLNWKPEFYIAFCSSMTAELSEYETAFSNIDRVLERVFDTIRYFIHDSDEQSLAISNINNAITNLTAKFYFGLKRKYSNNSDRIDNSYIDIWEKQSGEILEFLKNCDNLSKSCFSDLGLPDYRYSHDEFYEHLVLDRSASLPIYIEDLTDNFTVAENVNVDEFEKYEKLAFDAKFRNDYSNAFKYFNLLQQYYPNDWSYIFNTNYCYSMINYESNFNNAINQMYNCASTIFELIFELIFKNKPFQIQIKINVIVDHMDALQNCIYKSERSKFYMLCDSVRYSDKEIAKFEAKCELLCKLLEKYNEEVNKIYEYLFSIGVPRTFFNDVVGCETEYPEIDLLKKASDRIKDDIESIKYDKSPFWLLTSKKKK